MDKRFAQPWADLLVRRCMLAEIVRADCKRLSVQRPPEAEEKTPPNISNETKYA
jgi:hypothetical protein